MLGPYVSIDITGVMVESGYTGYSLGLGSRTQHFIREKSSQKHKCKHVRHRNIGTTSPRGIDVFTKHKLTVSTSRVVSRWWKTTFFEG